MNQTDIKKVIECLINYSIKDSKGNVIKENPIIIVGPSGSEPDKFRVYANGGQIGAIPINENNKEVSLADSDYKNYLKKEYENGHEHIYHCPTWLRNKYPKIEEFDKEFENIKKAKKDEKIKIMKDGSYLDIMVAATENRFHKHEENVDCERFVQTEIAKKLMQRKSGFVVTDIEYCFSSKVNEDNEHKCKPDIIVFDGKSFGLIELKFNGNSCTSSSNGAGLAKHFKDFYWLVNEADSKTTKHDAFDECIKRKNLLASYKIIADKWKDKNPEFDEKSSFWFGFLFVDDDERNSCDKIKDTITKEANNKLISDKDAFLATPCWYCKRNEVDKLDFTKKEKTLKDFLEEK